MSSKVCVCLALSLALNGSLAPTHAGGKHGPKEGESPSRITDEYIPLQYDQVPQRPRPLVEIGNAFMAPGPLSAGFRGPTGAIWQPTILVWGTLRSGLLVVQEDTDRTEWANRLDLFGELRLNGTERLVVGVRPLDENGTFSGYDFDAEEWVESYDIELDSLFFEGDFGELFPFLDSDDSGALDLGFSVGRQPLVFQNGLLLGNTMDAAAITRNSIRPFGLSNLRFTALFAWNGIDRASTVSGAGFDDDDAYLGGLLFEADHPKSLIELDIVGVASSSGGDGMYAGLGLTQRIGALSSTFRINGSKAIEDPTPFVDDGALLTAEFSTVPHGTHDNIYLNAFWAIESYTGASRDPSAAGPVAQTGILFAAPGLGTGGGFAPLDSSASEAAGAGLGWQKFFRHGRGQLIVETGGRYDTSSRDDKQSAVAAGLRLQNAIGRRTVLVLDAFGRYHEQFEESYGGRVELLVKF